MGIISKVTSLFTTNTSTSTGLDKSINSMNTTNISNNYTGSVLGTSTLLPQNSWASSGSLPIADFVYPKSDQYKIMLNDLTIKVRDFTFYVGPKRQKVVLNRFYNEYENHVEPSEALILSTDSLRTTDKLNIFTIDNVYLYSLEDCKFQKLEYNEGNKRNFELTFSYTNIINDPKVKQVYEMTLKGK